MNNRFSSSGLANSAADLMTEKTGKKWRMVFRPRSLNDRAPFMIEKVE